LTGGETTFDNRFRSLGAGLNGPEYLIRVKYFPRILRLKSMKKHPKMTILGRILSLDIVIRAESAA
jgi:hypothetical protein